MNDLIIYMLKVSAGTILLYLCFVFFFRKDTFYLRNRIILILTLLLPLIIPLIKISRAAVTGIQPEEIPIEVTVINSAITVGETFTGKVNSFDYNELIIMLWLGIATLLILRTIFGLVKTVSIIRKGNLKTDGFPKLIISEMEYPPFSFWPYAVIPRKIFESGDAEDIITHENAHIRQGHTFDLIICELYTSFFWFNPAAWLIGKSMRLNHEFLADHELTRRSADIKTYQYKLLNITEEFNHIQLAHSFNHLIKNRIVMINKKPTRTYATLKNLLIFPVVAIIIATFSFKAVNQIDNSTIVKQEADNITTQTSGVTNSSRVLTDIKIDKPANKLMDQKEKGDQEKQDNKKVYAKVEQMPQFPGGEKEMMTFIRTKLRYPVKAQEGNIQGTVITAFTINERGKIEDAKIVNSVDSLLDNEALRVLKSMPDWIPGRQGGKEVAVSYTLPFKFALRSENPILFSNVEVLPQFPGGEAALKSFLKSNLKYPVIAQEESASGIAVVEFVIKSDGKIADAKITNELHSSLKNEAFRAINMLPEWIPGKQAGKAVDVTCTIPIGFALASSVMKLEDVGTRANSMIMQNQEKLPMPIVSVVGFKGANEQIKDEDIDKVFIRVMKMPQFTGGMGEVKKFIQSNLKYPDIAREEKAEGTVTVRFVVNKVGKIEDAKIVRGAHPALDAEALRIVNSMPDWVPGQQGDKTLKVAVTIPLKFELSSLSVIPFAVVQQMPQTKEQPEGQKSPFSEDSRKQIYKLLQYNLRYPVIGQEMGVKGKVYVNLSIGSGGKILELNASDKIDVVKYLPLFQIVVIGYGVQNKNGVERPKPVLTDENIKFCQTALIKESQRAAKMIETLDLPEWKEKDMNFSCEFEFILQ